MKNILLIVPAILLMISCSVKQEEIIQKIIEASDIKTVSKHNYQYTEDGKILVDEFEEYSIVNGEKFVNFKITSAYDYNSKGLLIVNTNIIDSDDVEWKESLQIIYPFKNSYLYNSYDSIVARYSENEKGDTILFSATEYDDGNKIIKYIHNYADVLSVTDYTYKEGLVDKEIEKTNGEIESESEYVYEDTVLTKVIRYSFLAGSKYIESVKEFPRDSSGLNVIEKDGSGNIIYFSKTITVNDQKLKISLAESMLDSMFYNELGQAYRLKTVDMYTGLAEEYSYKYDEKGNLLEEVIDQSALR